MQTNEIVNKAVCMEGSDFQKYILCFSAQLGCTCQDKTVVGNSLTPPVALLVRPSGTIHPAVDRHEFTWSDKCCL